MAKKNFTQFQFISIPVTGDYLVGYKSDASTEIKIQVGSILSQAGYRLVNNTSIQPYTGNNNSIQGNYSAIGCGESNIIQANYCFAAGSETFTLGDYSSTFNANTTASGFASNAFGSSSLAEGDNSFAVGETTQAIGNFSFSGGIRTQALGRASFSINYETQAFGEDSAAINYQTIALGKDSFACGHKAQAIHDFSWAWQSTNYTVTTAVYLGFPIFGAVIPLTATPGTIVEVYTENNVIPLSTTRSGQFAVGAVGGVFLSGNVGINTDSIQNALTVNGTISATSPLKLSLTATPPNNTTTPVAWTDIYVNNTLYKLPLYQ